MNACNLLILLAHNSRVGLPTNTSLVGNGMNEQRSSSELYTAKQFALLGT